MSTRTTTLPSRPRARPAPARPPVGVDPRVRARWIAARRAEGRRRLRVLLVIGGALALVAVAWGITVSPLLAVDHVVITGARQMTPAQIERAGAVRVGDPLVWLDTGRAVSGIEALPYVSRARVDRQWPHTVRIVITERRGVAWAQRGHQPYLVDGSGRVLARLEAAPAGLPQLRGVGLVPRPGDVIAEVGAARAAAALPKLAALGTRSVTATHGVLTMQLLAGPEVRLGSGDQIRAKVRAAIAVLNAMADTVPSYVDVTVPTNPVAG
ncbi:MAG TPA: FtsQ-type POTRA domain-containing protein [Acidimicrobiia bacterium]